MPGKSRASPIRSKQSSKEPCAEWKRKLNERDAELRVALEEQTATREILRIISSSRTDTQRVFDAVAESVARLCQAHDVVIRLVDGNVHRAVAHHGSIPPSPPRSMTRATIAGCAMLDVQMLHIPDTTEARVREQYPESSFAQHRTILVAPLIRTNEVIGAIVMRRLEVRPFTDSQIKLLETFAAQAVIAIENARLFNETREALEQQRVISEILQAMSSSPTDTQPVFDAIVKGGAPLFGGMNMSLRLINGNQSETVASTLPFHETGANPLSLDDDNMPAARAIFRREFVQVPDAYAEEWVGTTLRKRAELRGFRSVMNAPMVRENKAIGTIAVTRAEPGAFTEKQVALLKTFADQAVIAIENVRLFNETKEALEQQTATANILRVISSSPTDIQPVLEAVAESAARLCEANDVTISRVDREVMRVAVHVGPLLSPPARPVAAKSVMTRAVRELRTVHVHDVGDPRHLEEYPDAVSARRRAYRTILVAPLIREDTAIGAIGIRRAEVRPFSDKQIKLLETFAAQAVIAIENVRLFKELEARNSEVTEALRQQTATAEILEVISSSPTDTQPVFDAILEGAARLCDSHLGTIGTYDGEKHQYVAVRTGNADVEKWVLDREPFRPHPGGFLSKVLESGEPVEIADLKESVGYRDRRPLQTLLVEQIGVRAHLSVPMLKEGRTIGTISIYRVEVRPFTQKEIDLVVTFANQAVIAIENVRLFKELQAQTEALSRSVRQLTALGEVGQAISSTLDLETVLQTIVSRALQLTGLDSGSIYEYDQQAQVFRLQAAENYAEEIVEAVRKTPIRTGDGVVGRTGVTRELTQVPDILDASYQSGRRDLLVRAGYRALLAVPLLREELLLGVLLVSRKTPGAFAPEIIELLKTFATQSALAIQNARLFREIAEKGRQLEEASQHKSNFLASMSHELRTPLNAILGFNEMILDEIYGPVTPDVRSPLEEMQASGKHLLRLINNVLDLAKIEAGRMELSLQDYSVPDTVESVCSTPRSIAVEKGLELLTVVPADIPLAHGDPGRMSQCLLNLAGNALKFTKAGKVEIGAKLEGDQLVYRVSDTGIGIPADKIESLFTEFRQTDATIASEYGGTGLGLSITKKFIEMHGGRIWIESELGKGSAFFFEVPLRAKTT